MRAQESDRAERLRALLTPIAMAATVTSGFLFACRVLIAARGATPDSGAESPLVQATGAFGMDALAVVGVATLALLLGMATRRGGALLATVAYALMVVAGAANVRIAPIFGQPANLGLLLYGDFLSLDGLRSLLPYLTASDAVVSAGALVAIALIIAAGLPRVARPVGSRPALWALAVGSGAVLALCSVLAIARNDEDIRQRNANAAWWMLVSLAEERNPPVENFARPDLAAPFETVQVGSKSPLLRTGYRRTAPVRNVVLIVLESVGSAYLDLAADPSATPNLARLRKEGVWFSNATAQVPGSPMSLFSLTTGMYSPAAPVAIPLAEPGYPAPTLFDRFHAGGRRTAIFSALWGFIDFEAYAKARGADYTHQFASGCESGEEGDARLFAGAREWIERPDGAFFAMLWPIGPHFPYCLDPARATADPALARQHYMAAIERLDAQVGSFIAALDRAGRLDDTLVVIVGDHGEAFNQHANHAHGRDIYRESVGVPLLFMNARRLASAVDEHPVRMIDVAPTILSLAGLPIPATMQGVDLTSPRRPQRVFMSAPWTNFVLGYREGQRTYHYFPRTGELRAFDLARDPGERRNLASALSPDQRRAVIRRLVNWKSAVDVKIAAGRKSSSTARAEEGS